MPSSDLRDAVLFLAPGFIALRVYGIYGFQRPRTDWQWAIWSVIASIPLDLMSRWVVGLVQQRVVVTDIGEGSIRIVLAVGTGAVLAFIWSKLRFARRLRAQKIVGPLMDSMWDTVLEEATHFGRTIEVETTTGDVYTSRWFGAAREDTQAERWIGMRFPRLRRAGSTDVDELEEVVEVLLHGDQIRKITVLESPDEMAKRLAIGA